MNVGVIGAGLAGLAAARCLAAAGHSVVVLDKGRGVGGRLASRREAGTVFDHGCPSVTLGPGGRLEALVELVSADARIELTPRVPGTREIGFRTGVSGLAKAMAADLDVRTSVRIGAIRAGSGGLELAEDQGNTRGLVDAVILTAPAPQAIEILERSGGDAARIAALRGVVYDPAVVLLATVVGASPSPESGWFAEISHETAKGRLAEGGAGPVVARLTDEVSARLLDAPDSEVLAEAIPALREALGLPDDPTWSQVKRWRYSRVSAAADFDLVNPPDTRIVVCGDSVAGGDLESVCESGIRAAERVAALG